jgi:hypothetical protein
VPDPDQEDPRVVQILKEYQADLDAGRQPDREALVRRHPEVAAAVTEALDALAFVQAAVPRLHPAAPPALPPGPHRGLPGPPQEPP